MKQIFLAVAVVSLSGCSSIKGAPRLLDAQMEPTTLAQEATPFVADFNKALRDRVENQKNSDNPYVPAMLSSGFSYIYSYCDNYFDVMGTRQRQSRLARDTIAPLSALITGIIALQNFDSDPGEKEDLLAILGLVTAGSAAVLDIYDEHMLFGADNIASVEILTKNALDAHKTKVLSFDGVSFDAARNHLLDNQAICSPQHILLLAREAIKEGKVAANPNLKRASNDKNAASIEDQNSRVEVQIENSGG